MMALKALVFLTLLATPAAAQTVHFFGLLVPGPSGACCIKVVQAPADGPSAGTCDGCIEITQAQAQAFYDETRTSEASPLERPVIGGARGVSMTNTTDQRIMIFGRSKYRITGITISDCSGSPTGAVGGIYAQPAKAGATVVPAAQTYAAAALGTAGGLADLTLTAVAQTHYLVANNVFLHLDTPATAAATCNIVVSGLLWP